eukprot:TRINITY_DN888_c1_g1_i1.p1 TRINITY_DN888_c1_g1~~TRINITY_DN888_c1_g1_i1.p1  ORF type:complete len:398 (+),score=77.32 TRINITY_DN888_c1_g1_i1:40-1194(+)
MADQELEAILKGLGGSGANLTAPAAAGGDKELDSILGALSGTTIAPAVQDLSMPRIILPRCAGCNTDITSGVVNAMGKQWHLEHFCCAQCQIPFMDKPFVPSGDQAFCESCYGELFSVRCARCQEAITDRAVTVLGKKYHPEHLLCERCNVPLHGKKFFDWQSNPVCGECKAKYVAETSPDAVVHECGKCGKPIYGEYILLGSRKLHPEHFSCAQCGIALRGGNSFELEDKMYCERDYNHLINSTCAGCKQPIDGRSISALGRQWHPEHFVCTDCDKSFDGGKYFERDKKAYCQLHFYARFGSVCDRCQKPVSSQAVNTMGKVWHTECFKCTGCEKSLAGDTPKDYNTNPMCAKCFHKLPSEVRKKAEKEAEKRQEEEKKKRKG